MRKKVKAKKPKRGNERKLKLIIAVTVEILIMAIKVLSCLLPMLWRFGILIVIGAMSTIMQAIRKYKVLQPNAQGHKIITAVVIEIVIMAVEILCCLMPMPWRIIVPIIIGARAIILQAIRSYNQPKCSYCSSPASQKTRKVVKKK